MEGSPGSDQAAVRIELLGCFRAVVDGREVTGGQWPGRRSAELVQLLALAEGRRLPRERCIETLWGHLQPEAGAANLRKAAHQARRALGDREAVVLRSALVELFPARAVEIDAERFECAAEAALAAGDPAACAAAAARYAGDLLPQARYEQWAQEPHRRLRALVAELCRRSGQWERVIAIEPADEQAHLELMRAALAAGRRHEAIRWYGRLRTTLARELGAAPSRDASALYAQCVASLGPIEPEFVDRQLELARAAAALGAAARSHVRAVLVRGPAGIGKSAFCRSVAAAAREQGWTAIVVAAAPWDEPYAPLVAMIEELLAKHPEVIATMPETYRSLLAALTPLGRPAPPLTGPLRRHQVIGMVRRIVAGLSGTSSGVLLCLDQTEAADDATAEALYHLASAGGDRLVVVFAHRPQELRPPLRRVLATLDRGGRAVEIDLRPLDRDAAAALAATAVHQRLEPGVVERIVELAEGSPFFILELARGASVGAPFAIPPSARAAIVSRFLDLDEGTLAMLTRLAVAERDLDLASVLALTDLTEDDAGELLDSALARGVLAVSGERYRFRHELVREALVERLPPHRRIAIHRDAARRLAAAGAPAAAIARHWLAADRPDEAARWLRAAARAAVARGAFADALRSLGPLLAHAPGDPEALALRAEALEAVGDAGATAAFAAAAAAAGPPGSIELRAKGALARLKSGDPAGALEWLEGLTPTTTAGRLAEALTFAGASAIGFGDPELAARKADETRRLAFELGDAGAVAEAAWACSLAAHARGRLRSSLRSELDPRRAPPGFATRVFDGYLCASERLLHGALPYGEVIAFADSLAAEAERRDAARGVGFAIVLRAMARLLSGRLDEADRDLTAAVALHHEIAAPAGEALALQQRALVALYRGRRADADELLAGALAAARESSLQHHLLDRIYGTRVAAALSPDETLARIDEAEAAARGPGETCPTCRITLAVPAAIAAARAGDVARAIAYAQTAERLTKVIIPLPGKRAEVDELWGHVERAQGNRDGARKRFRSACAGFRAAGQPLDEARCTELAAHPE